MDEIDRFLYEDLNDDGDITSNAIFSHEIMNAQIIVKESAIIAGLDEAKNVFDRTGAELNEKIKDGNPAKSEEIIASINGPIKAILKGERLALNFLGRMSGIATETNRIVQICRPINPDIEISATRKTTPGFRYFEKKAVQLGGGTTHRFGLFDAAMIKDNHIKAKGSFIETITLVKNKIKNKIIEVEVENEEQAIQAANLDVDVIMLDNFSVENAKQVAEKIKSINPSILIEISGGITPETILGYVAFSDRISMGYLTHTVRNIDFSLEINLL
jgi:nicotinate-nucleotide pyrophosphorylase (carboxylating)